ncbi:hypothetical protein PUMCH_001066 [Australozyma saopauloensis]|uniref:Double-strand break repair protein n=1 Tax=Australozyma saopauloensis TaxID=291208 RepID=A0AAX4H632_9ASCO|nr:hypothetical protein PUMCH_001066 [[Candida] saopauloensis]
MPPVDSIPPGPDTVRILLTTDNHVGYLDSDPIRGNDSWITFQEITRLAKTHDVDMMVQGGDLFHVSRPSKKALYHVIQALRLNCLGDRPCELELLSDPSLALRASETVNYEDPNLNVAVPMFAISGNHDDATGEGLLSPLDVMAATGLVNYFGQVPLQDKLQATPLVFQKGSSKLALYGINNVRDERLQRIMRSGNMTFQRPANNSDFFNLLCIHQNHHRRSMTSYVPEDFLPLFLDFVFWGHEHECIPFPQYNPTTGFDTLQAGSSVATSLSEGETAKKFVFILDIKGTDYAITPIPLQTVRPFVMEDVSLKDEGFMEGPASKSDIADFLFEKVNELIAEAKNLYKAAGGTDEDILPLIRLRVDHTGDYEIENARRFSNKFVGKVANVNDIIHYFTKKVPERQAGSTKVVDLKLQLEASQKVTIQQLLKEHLGESSLHLVPEDGMFDVTRKFIEQDDKQVFLDFVKQTIENATSSLLDVDLKEDELQLDDGDNVKKSFRELLTKLKIDSKKEDSDTLPPLKELPLRTSTKVQVKKTPESTPAPTSRGRSQARGASTKSKAVVVSEDDGESDPEILSDSEDDIVDSDLEDEANNYVTASSRPTRAKTPAKKASVKKTSKPAAPKKQPRVLKAPAKKPSTRKAASSDNHLLDDLLSLG